MVWIILGILVLLALIQALIEPFIIRTSYQDLPLGVDQLRRLEKKRTIPPLYPGKNLPELKKGKLRLLFFSDLHANHFYLPTSIFIKKIFKHRPDVLVFGGDLISKEHHAEKGLNLLKIIAVEAAKHSIPVFVLRGNHDAGIEDDALKNCGVILLKNAGIRLKFKPRYQGDAKCEYLLLGLDDRRTGTVDKELSKKMTAFPQTEVLNLSFTHNRFRFEALTATENGPSFKTLIFAHNPDTVLGLSDNDGDYFFSGHFHGGQIRLPFRLEFKSLRGEVLSQEKYYSGLFIRNGLTSFISCGVGCVLFPMRYFSLPEITVFDI